MKGEESSNDVNTNFGANEGCGQVATSRVRHNLVPTMCEGV